MNRRHFLQLGAGATALFALPNVVTASVDKTDIRKVYKLMYDCGKTDALHSLWMTCRLADIQKGDIFRMHEPDGNPVVYKDFRCFVAIKDAYYKPHFDIKYNGPHVDSFNIHSNVLGLPITKDKMIYVIDQAIDKAKSTNSEVQYLVAIGTTLNVSFKQKVDEHHNLVHVDDAVYLKDKEVARNIKCQFEKV